ncbi:MAG TPA: hypothetical protein ENK18_01690 [Deltaproteobacteria bacterium]|nr:hypothetical protein [Deltaproteobacteria bacterium]
MGEHISFDRSLYAPAAIESAVAAYHHLATFAVIVGDDHTEVQISEIDARVSDVLIDAFCNHALYETVVLGRATEPS